MTKLSMFEKITENKNSLKEADDLKLGKNELFHTLEMISKNAGHLEWKDTPEKNGFLASFKIYGNIYEIQLRKTFQKNIDVSNSYWGNK